jgi:hypothetical protein
VSTRAASWLAWSLCGLSLVLTALSLFLFALNLFYSGAHDYDYYWLQNAVQAGSFSIIGAISSLPAFPPTLWAGSSVQQPVPLRWSALAPSMPSMPYWPDPTRYR